MATATRRKRQQGTPCACGCGELTVGEYRRRHRPPESFESLATRLRDRLDVGGPNECWEFARPQHDSGYGQLYFRGRLHLAHRLAVMLDGRDVTDAFVCHRCDNPPCCNPAHLYVGDALTNARDVCERGDWNRQKGEDHCHSRLSDEDVRDIRRRYVRKYARGEPPAYNWRSNSLELSKEYGISIAYVGDLARGKWRKTA